MPNQFTQGKPRGEPYRLRGLNLPIELDKKVEDYQFAHRHKSYTGAITELLQKALTNTNEAPQ